VILTERQLAAWGHRVGQAVGTPVFLGLRGPLGAGKSVLARAVARGAGVRGALPSPTFNLVFRYSADRGIYVVHMDLYRIGDPDELLELGWEELGAPDELILVEWSERAGEQLPEDRWEIELAPVQGTVLLRALSLRRHGFPPDLPDPGPYGEPGGER
jgi:tRNA threonylcarbamoyladenosine biosynthesis protein TsaE